MIEVCNFSPIIGAVINARLAALKDMQLYYSTEDILNLYETIIVDSYNARVAGEK